MTMVCKGMKFTRFPLDAHTCYLRLTSCKFFCVCVVVFVPTSLVFAVGYDDRRMVLDGEFTYEFWNQRALPFNVQILEISDEMKVYAGSTSKIDETDCKVHRIVSSIRWLTDPFQSYLWMGWCWMGRGIAYINHSA